MKEQTNLLEKLPPALSINNRLAEIEAEGKILRRLLPLAMAAEQALKERDEDRASEIAYATTGEDD